MRNVTIALFALFFVAESVLAGFSKPLSAEGIEAEEEYRHAFYADATLVSEGLRAVEEFQLRSAHKSSETRPEWFGYSGSAEYFESELSGFANISPVNGAPGSAVCPFDATELVESVSSVRESGAAPWLFLHEVFFKAVSGGDDYLRSDYRERWKCFATAVRGTNVLGGVTFFYLADEPAWHGLAPYLEDVVNLVLGDFPKGDFPNLYLGIIEAFPRMEELVVPRGLDFVGLDNYRVMDPVTDEYFQYHLSLLKSKMYPGQKLMIVMDGYWSAGHGRADITPEDLETIAWNYYNLAVSEGVWIIGVFHYHFNGSQSIGSRELPVEVILAQSAIAAEVTGGCSLPRLEGFTPGSVALLYDDCRFAVSLLLTKRGLESWAYLHSVNRDKDGKRWSADFLLKEGTRRSAGKVTVFHNGGRVWLDAAHLSLCGYSMTLFVYDERDREEYSFELECGSAFVDKQTLPR